MRENCIEKSYEVGSLLFAVNRLLFLVYYSALKYKVRSLKYETITPCHFERSREAFKGEAVPS